MSEQAKTFQKHRDANDPQGNLLWATRLGQKALRAAAEAAARMDVERELQLSDDEKIIWRLLKLPRRYMDLESCGVLPREQMRGVLRGLVSADIVDIVDGAQAKALIPAELKRLRAEIEGKEITRPREPLRGRVYRPDLDGGSEPTKPGATPPASTPPSSASSTDTKSPAGSGAGFGGPVHTDPGVVAKMSDEERLIREDVLRAFHAMAKQNHYEFMGVPRNTDDSAVRQAYVRLAREYHPDRVAGGGLGADESLRAKIDALFKRLGDAHHAIGSAEARSSYDRELGALGGNTQAPADGKRQRRPLEAQNAFRMAEIFFKKKDFKQAEAHYRQATMFDGEDPKILTAFAFCIWLNTDQDEKARTEDAKKRLAEVVQKHRYGDAAYKLGLILRKNNDEPGAQRQFATANRLDPNHVDAQREIRLASMRHQKAEQDKKDAASFINKILKK